MPRATTGPARAPGTVSAGSVVGVPVRVSVTTVVLVAVLAFALVPRIDQERPGLGLAAYAVGAVVGVAVYVAVLAHELAHAIAARRYGHEVESITLSLIGGRTAVQGEAHGPREEFVTAIVGPLTSLALGAVALGLRVLVGDGSGRVALEVIILANLVLGLLDLVPAPPMDGGRLVKAAGWGITGSARRGAVVAARGGRVVAVAVLALTLVVVPLVQERPVVSRHRHRRGHRAAAVDHGDQRADRLAAAARRWGTSSCATSRARTLAVPPDLPLAEAVRRASRGRRAGPGDHRLRRARARRGERRRAGRRTPTSDGRGCRSPTSRGRWPTTTGCRPTSPATSCSGAINRAPVAEYLLIDAAGLLVGVLSLERPRPRGARALSPRGGPAPARPADAARLRYGSAVSTSEPDRPAEGIDVAPEAWSGVHRGPLRVGEWVRLVDAKGRKHNICLEAGKTFHTNRGGMSPRRPDRARGGLHDHLHLGR